MGTAKRTSNLEETKNEELWTDS